MGNVIWDNVGGVANDGNDAANYTPARVPTAGDVADFDSATTSDNCTFSGNISCDGMLFATAYAGIVDAATHDIALGANGLDCTGGGSATLDLGEGNTWTCDGNWDSADLDTLTGGTATVNLTGSGKTWELGDGKIIYGLTIAAGASITKAVGGEVRLANNLTVDGALVIDAGGIRMDDSTIVGSGAGSVTGSGGFSLRGFSTGDGILSLPGTFSPGIIILYYADWDGGVSTWAPGTYDCDIWLYATSGLNCRMRLSSGAYTITGTLTLWANTNTLTFDPGTNDADVTLEDDVVFTESGGTVVWNAGNGTLTASGTNDQDWDLGGLSVEAIEVDKDAGTLTVSSNVSTPSFTLIKGDLDLGTNNVTLTASGAVDFQSGVTVADLAGSTIACDTFSADGQTLGSSGGYSDDVPSALGSGQSMEFDGVDDYVGVADDNSLDISTNLTISVWIKTPTPAADEDTVIAKLGAGGNDHANYMIRQKSGGIRFEGYAGGYVTTGVYLLTANQWHHVVGVYDGTNAMLYVDNVLRSTVAWNVPLETSNGVLTIGRFGGYGQYWNGFVDDLRIFNDLPTANELTYLFTDGDSGDDPTDTNLQGHWKFDGDLLDETANNNDGTVYGQTWYINASTSATISGSGTISNLDASGGVKVFALDAVNGGGNLNVDFGAVLPSLTEYYYRHLLAGSCGV